MLPQLPQGAQKRLLAHATPRVIFAVLGISVLISGLLLVFLFAGATKHRLAVQGLTSSAAACPQGNRVDVFGRCIPVRGVLPTPTPTPVPALAPTPAPRPVPILPLQISVNSTVIQQDGSYTLAATQNGQNVNGQLEAQYRVCDLGNENLCGAVKTGPWENLTS